MKRFLKLDLDFYGREKGNSLIFSFISTVFECSKAVSGHIMSIRKLLGTPALGYNKALHNRSTCKRFQ